MTPLSAQPSAELGLDLVRDAVDIRRLPRWDPRYWGHLGIEDEPRCREQFRTLGLSGAKAHAATRAQVQTGSLASECLPHERDGARQLAEHELRLEPKDAIAREPKSTVPAPVGPAPACVIAAIDLDDEACRGGTEVNDEGAEQDLALEREAQLTAANSLPKALFGARQSRAQGVSAGREQLSASDIERAFLGGARWNDLHGILRMFGSEGGTQKEAIAVLDALRRPDVDEAQDDLVLELMDCVWGHCMDRFKIW
jgi:hypothetical protein